MNNSDPDLEQAAAVAARLTEVLRAAPHTVATMIDARLQVDPTEVAYLLAHPQVQLHSAPDAPDGPFFVGVLGLLQAAMPAGYLLMWFRPAASTVALLNGEFEGVNIGAFVAICADEDPRDSLRHWEGLLASYGMKLEAPPE